MKFTNSWTGNWENAFRGLRHPMESYAKSDSEFGLENLEYIRDRELIRVDGELGEYAAIGPNDMDLAQRMIKAGSPNDKFLRQIFVSVDITGPLYWWKEMDTYKVATVANSTSTMHKLASTPITLDCFETDDLDLSIPVGAWAMAGEKEYTPEPDYNSPNITSFSFKKVDLETNEILEEQTNYYSSEELAELKKRPLEDSVYGIINILERLRQKYLETKDIRYWKELIRWLPESWLQTRAWSANYSTLRGIIHWRSTHRLTEWRQFVEWCHTLPYSEELLFYENRPE